MIARGLAWLEADVVERGQEFLQHDAHLALCQVKPHAVVRAGAEGDVGEGATGGLPGCGAGAGAVALPGMGAGAGAGASAGAEPGSDVPCEQAPIARTDAAAARAMIERMTAPEP